MKIRILSLALQDLENGKEFYERQRAGLGTYFLDALFSDIDALLIHAGGTSAVLRLFPDPIKALSLCDLLHAYGRLH